MAACPSIRDFTNFKSSLGAKLAEDPAIIIHIHTSGVCAFSFAFLFLFVGRNEDLQDPTEEA
jgi:hypothetical protein